MSFSKILKGIISFCVYTVITQVGGMVYLVNLLPQAFFESTIKDRILKQICSFLSFIFLYAIASILIVPVIAKSFGRVPLPCDRSGKIQPATIWTCILCRNYVTTAMYDVVNHAALAMNNKYPGTVVNYLDAGFPFFDDFPLLPHLSHDDGRKLDVSFCYNNEFGSPSNKVPSLIGYCAYEEPQPGEESKLAECAAKGYWQYNFLANLLKGYKRHYFMNETKTRDLVSFFASDQATKKIFIEPYLKTRLHLETGKVRFQGCQSVRHDDHFHVEVN